MRVVVQRVTAASVTVAGREVASIAKGLVALAAFTAGDNEETVAWMARKLPTLRIFEDDEGKMNRSLEDVGGELLLVSQFTLYGDCRKGKRPSFDRSAPPEQAAELYRKLLQKLREETKCPVAEGVFQEHMRVSLVNDGPVTIIVEKEER